MTVIEIPASVFLYRLERLIRIRNDPRNIAKMLYDLFVFNIENIAYRNIKVVISHDTISVVVGKTVVDYHDDSDKKWLMRYLVYKPTDEELKTIAESVK